MKIFMPTGELTTFRELAEKFGSLHGDLENETDETRKAEITAEMESIHDQLGALLMEVRGFEKTST